MLARISVRLDPDTRAALERIAKAEERTLSQIAARALTAWLRGMQSTQQAEKAKQRR